MTQFSFYGEARTGFDSRRRGENCSLHTTHLPLSGNQGMLAVIGIGQEGNSDGIGVASSAALVSEAVMRMLLQRVVHAAERKDTLSELEEWWSSLFVRLGENFPSLQRYRYTMVRPAGFFAFWWVDDDLYGIFCQQKTLVLTELPWLMLDEDVVWPKQRWFASDKIAGCFFRHAATHDTSSIKKCRIGVGLSSTDCMALECRSDALNDWMTSNKHPHDAAVIIISKT